MFWENPEGGNKEKAWFLAASFSYSHPKCNLLFLKKPHFSLLRFLKIYFFMCMNFFLCVCVCACEGQRRVLGLLTLELQDTFGPPCGFWKQKWIFWKSSKCSALLRCLPSPYNGFYCWNFLGYRCLLMFPQGRSHLSGSYFQPGDRWVQGTEVSTPLAALCCFIFFIQKNIYFLLKISTKKSMFLQWSFCLYVAFFG